VEDLSLEILFEILLFYSFDLFLFPIMASSDSEINISEKGVPSMESGLDAEAGNLQSVQLGEFGKLLVPTPTTDPLDPLNWSKVQKYTIMAIVCFSYFMLTYFTPLRSHPSPSSKSNSMPPTHKSTGPLQSPL
jgi:hypothetical protein